MKFSNFTAGVALATLTCFGASANVMNYTLADKNMARSNFGTQKTETYNIAVRLNDPSFIGSKVIGIRVPMQQTPNISATKAFLTKELAKGKSGDSKANNPDILEVDADYADGYLTATFETPYVITEDPFYAGYTFTVTGIDAYSQLPVVGTAETNADGFFLMTSRSYLKWKSYSESRNFTSCLEVILDGDFASSSVGTSYTHIRPLSANSEFKLPVTLVNHGSEKISKIDYTYKLTGVSTGDVVEKSGTVEFSPALDLTFGATQRVDLDVDARGTEVGDYTLEVTLDKINGLENNDPAKYFKADEYLYPYVPQKRVLMEEYTGFWCGNCPRGFAAMEHMSKKYPDTFIAVAYHHDDQLQHVPTGNFPNTANSFPGCYLDRDTSLGGSGGLIDPYAGSVRSGFYIETDFQNLVNKFTPVDVKVKANLTTETGIITVDAQTQFVENVKGTPRIAFLLLADKLREKVAEGKEPTWLQHNYFSGNNINNWLIPEMQQFCNGPSVMGDLEWNDILVMYSDLLGEQSTLQNIKLEEWMEDSFTFDINKCQSVANRYSVGYQNLIKDHRDFTAVALVIDRNTNKVINSAKTKVLVDGFDNVSSVENSEIVDTAWYNLAGSRVENPTNGIYVKVVSFADGRRVSEKVAVRN